MIFIGAVALIVLAGAAGLAAWVAVAGVPEGWLPGFTTWWGRTVLGVLAASFLGAAALAIRCVAEHAASRRAVRRPGPKGEIIIAPRAIRELATVLLTRDLGLSGFRVGLRPGADGVYIKVVLRLPPEEEAPSLADRIQELLSREIQSKTGIPVHEVNLAIRGTASSQPAAPPSEPRE
ncbi:MAG: hypothetical protein R6U88_01505 [Candidatus Bipolaricaulota bacterium]